MEWISVAVVGCIIAIFAVLDFSYRRSMRRLDRFYQKDQHQKTLVRAQAEGETSILFHAMQCTICGGFHRQDDTECPALDKEG